jgi:hypothetical protein
MKFIAHRLRKVADTGAMKLEVDPVRLRALRTRLSLPLEAAAERAGLDSDFIEMAEACSAMNAITVRARPCSNLASRKPCCRQGGGPDDVTAVRGEIGVRGRRAA